MNLSLISLEPGTNGLLNRLKWRPEAPLWYHFQALKAIGYQHSVNSNQY
jgi:hypothetical protein